MKGDIISSIRGIMIGGAWRNMKNMHAFILVLAMAPLVLAGCDSVSSLLGGKSSPDEFSVYSRAPLSIPPEYKLRPPSPGAARPQELEPRETAEKVFLGSRQQASARSGRNPTGNKGDQGALAPAPVSPGEQALVRNAGASKTDPEIRAIVNREALVPLAGSKALADKVLFWRSPRTQINIVDPGKENKRIRDQKAKGKPVTSEGVPVIDKDLDRGFLDGLLFD